MKILTLNYEFPPIGGGVAPVSRDIAIQMTALGHEVTVVTMGFANLPEYEDIENVVSTQTWLHTIKKIRIATGFQDIIK